MQSMAEFIGINLLPNWIFPYIFPIHSSFPLMDRFEANMPWFPKVGHYLIMPWCYDILIEQDKAEMV